VSYDVSLLGAFLTGQRINHFPGITNLTRKDTLYAAVRLFCVRRKRRCVMPLTFNLPSEYRRLCSVLNPGAQGRRELLHYQKRDGAGIPNGTAQNPSVDAPIVFIIKPTALSRGREIKLAEDISQVDYSLPSIAQQYLLFPALLNGRKCDLRIYVLLLCGNPAPTGQRPGVEGPWTAPQKTQPRMCALISREGLCRLCTKPYTTDCLDDKFVHLTNTSINACNETAFRRMRMLMSEALPLLSESGGDTGHYTPAPNDSTEAASAEASRRNPQACLWEKIKTVISVGLSSVLCSREEQKVPPLAQCFELLGVDVILASSTPGAPLYPYLLEFNSSPSLAMACNVDDALKPRVLADIMHIVRVHACTGGIVHPFGWFETLNLLW